MIEFLHKLDERITIEEAWFGSGVFILIVITFHIILGW